MPNQGKIKADKRKRESNRNKQTSKMPNPNLPMDALLYFGSFNPVHKGHIAIAQAAIAQHIAQEVWFVLSPQNPFKASDGLWPESEREERLRKALEPYPAFRLCDAELHLPKPSYTIQTLDFLLQRYPGKRFGILMGEDNLTRLHLWKDFNRILADCDIWVYPRANRNPNEAIAGSNPETPNPADTSKPHSPAEWSCYPAVQQFPEKIHRLDCPLLDISSTQIRQLLGQGKDVSSLIP